MKQTRSLKFNIWLYFMLFVIIVFTLLWVFQIVFFENFYKKNKMNDIDKIAEDILNLDITNLNEDDANTLNNISINNDISMIGYDKYKRKLFFTSGNFGLMQGYDETPIYLQKLISSKDGIIKYVVNEKRTNKEMVIYGCVIGSVDNPNGYLLLCSPLEPVESTVSIIKKQMYIISAVLIILGAIISSLASKMIASPLAKITKSAEKLAKGNYNIEFDGNGYMEVHQLANTLNYASKEISRVDTLQRDLIANVSHDLRTPLTMLKAYAEMIRDLSGNNPVKREEHLNIIIDETDRLALLVTDMLDLSKIESGSNELNYSAFDIRGKLSEIIDRYKGLSERMGYNIYFEPDNELMVYCDIVKIEQVIYNLINNAINYTGEDKNIYIRQINQEDGVRIEIRDTGQGISEENIKLIFDKYYRSENHKREVIGTGLGLSIVKAVLKKHNFAYGVQSTIGKGSTFWFKVKIADKCEPINDNNKTKHQ